MRKITHVAIRYNGEVHALPAPNRHHNVIRLIASINGEGIKGPDTQGFLDDGGNFLTRPEAFALASKNGQLLRNQEEGSYQGNLLFSEDLW